MTYNLKQTFFARITYNLDYLVKKHII